MNSHDLQKAVEQNDLENELESQNLGLNLNLGYSLGFVLSSWLFLPYNDDAASELRNAWFESHLPVIFEHLRIIEARFKKQYCSRTKWKCQLYFLTFKALSWISEI